MNYMKQHIIPILITAFISFIGYILLSIFSDILPIIIPALSKLSMGIYLKMVLLLMVVIVILVLIISAVISKSKPYRPRTDKGKLYNISWSAEIEYMNGEKMCDIRTYISWFCPKHQTPLSSQQANVSRKAVHTLYCDRCNKAHDIKNRNTIMYLEEAEMIVRQQILDKINISR